MDKNRKADLLQEAVDTPDTVRLGALLVEVMLGTEEDVRDIAADFIENEVGRLDWQNNWKVLKTREDPASLVQRYLDRLGLEADARAVIRVIDHMSANNPGRWK